MAADSTAIQTKTVDNRDASHLKAWNNSPFQLTQHRIYYVMYNILYDLNTENDTLFSCVIHRWASFSFWVKLYWPTSLFEKSSWLVSKLVFWAE